jgi:hypothetical protein
MATYDLMIVHLVHTRSKSAAVSPIHVPGHDAPGLETPEPSPRAAANGKNRGRPPLTKGARDIAQLAGGARRSPAMLRNERGDKMSGTHRQERERKRELMQPVPWRRKRERRGVNAPRDVCVCRRVSVAVGRGFRGPWAEGPPAANNSRAHCTRGAGEPRAIRATGVVRIPARQLHWLCASLPIRGLLGTSFIAPADYRGPLIIPRLAEKHRRLLLFHFKGQSYLYIAHPVSSTLTASLRASANSLLEGRAGIWIRNSWYRHIVAF